MIKFIFYLVSGLLFSFITHSNTSWFVKIVLMMIIVLPLGIRNRVEKDESKWDKLIDFLIQIIGYSLGYLLRFLIEGFFENILKDTTIL